MREQHPQLQRTKSGWRAAVTTHTLLRSAAGLLAAGVLAVSAGCATPKPVVNSRLIRYDLGPPQLAQGVPGPRPTVKMASVSGLAAIDDDRIRYRLAYADIRQLQVYSHSRWTAAPSQLLTARLRDRMASRVQLLPGGDPDRAPLLRLDLVDFSQRFDAARKGVGVIQVRALLRAPWPDSTAHPGSAAQWTAQRDFVVDVPSATPDAAGAAAALAQAADRLGDNVSAWLVDELKRTNDAAGAAR